MICAVLGVDQPGPGVCGGLTLTQQQQEDRDRGYLQAKAKQDRILVDRASEGFLVPGETRGFFRGFGFGVPRVRTMRRETTSPKWRKVESPQN
mmetsp:Transcript_16572/g.38063  ORF Transcript_16572/g.38063 Transcript_16572/m.38063 type:complete len:93 (+) Transcript_16572:1563-1841(+)